MNTPPDKIRILLIDDNPKGLYHHEDREDYPWIFDIPRDPLKLSTLFDVRWIATSIEAREYRDISRLIAQNEPTKLEWLPEIVVIDYMLLDQNGRAEDRLSAYPDKQHLSPLSFLRNATIPNNSQIGPRQKLEPFSGAEKIMDSESDYGCFAGGMILALFADHPCVPVTTTGHSQATIRQRMTGFFEWLLTEDTGGALHADSQKMDWLQIVRRAGPRLQDRIKELARTRAISLSLADMLALSEGHDLDALVLESKYGVRRLSIEGLFCDKAPGHMTAAQTWAQKLLTELLGEMEAKNHFPNLNKAIELTDIVWDHYLNDDLVRARLELGHAVQDLKHNIKHPDQPKQIDLNRIGVLWSTFSTKPFDKDYATSTAPKLDNNVADIRIGNYSNLSRRWACLMLLVRLLQMRAEATRFVTQFDERLNDTDKRILGAELQEYDVYLSWFPVSQGPVDLDKITSRGWKAVLDRNVDHPTEMGVSLNIGDLLHGRAWQVDAEGNGTYGLKPGERELLHWYALSLTPKFQRRDWDQQACRVLLGGA